jgi:arylsulfatase A-like enzyme
VLALVALVPGGGNDAAAAALDTTTDPWSEVVRKYAVAAPVEPLPMTDGTAQRPNIVLITTDDQATTDLQHMPLTRKLLVEEGVSLQGISPHPLCCPARAEILTGQYAQNNRVRSNKGSLGGYKRLRTDQTLATYLHAEGYQTIFTGKFLNGYTRADQAAQMPGWTSWNPTLQNVYQYNNFTVANDGVAVRHHNTYQTDYFTKLAEDRIATAVRSDRPFFLWQSYVAPHTASVDEEETNRWSPPPPAERHKENPYTGLPAAMQDPSYAEADVSDKPTYIQNMEWTVEDAQTVTELNRARIGALQAVDEGVRDMMSALRHSGELDETLVIFTSDNGYQMGEHRYQGKTLPYEPSLSVPFLIRGPGIPAGVTKTQIGATIDIAPTIIAAAGATAVRRVDGRNLLPVVRNDRTSWTTLLIQAGPRGRIDAPFGWFYRGVRDERWTYVFYPTSGEEELYDRWLDPAQLDSVAQSPAHAPVIEELRRRLELLESCAGAACRVDFGPTPAPLA